MAGNEVQIHFNPFLSAPVLLLGLELAREILFAISREARVEKVWVVRVDKVELGWGKRKGFRMRKPFNKN